MTQSKIGIGIVLAIQYIEAFMKKHLATSVWINPRIKKIEDLTFEDARKHYLELYYVCIHNFLRGTAGFEKIQNEFVNIDNSNVRSHWTI